MYVLILEQVDRHTRLAIAAAAGGSEEVMPFTFESVDEWLNAPGSLGAGSLDTEEAELRAALGLPQ